MWTISEERFQPERQHHKETIFTTGNGYLSTRGSFEEGYPGDRRATFVHGVFDDVPVVFTELANAPDWLPLSVYLEGERFSLDRGTVSSYQRSLDLRSGVLTRKVDWISPNGKAAVLTFQRFASLDDEHLLCLRCTIQPDFDGKVELRLALNGNTENDGIAHWRWVEQGVREGDIAYLHVTTRKTAIDLALAMRIVSSIPAETDAFWDVENRPTRSLVFSAHRGLLITVDKLVGIATSRDSHDPTGMAVEHAQAVTGWEAAIQAQEKAWLAEWERMDVQIEGDEAAQRAVRSSLFQLLIAAPRHDDRVNIGAKTLSGFGYRGHSFWDTETFMLPVFIYTSPAIAKNLLNYRYQRLEAAREKAQQNGCEGAQFPWESAGKGDEVTPTWVPHYADRTKTIRIWTGDIEIHISADIAYASNLYWKVTGDDAWMIEKGAEIILDTAKFWASRAEWNAQTGQYEYNDVIGPDEYHDHVDDNFYTNYMARWNLVTALDILEWLEQRAPEKAHALAAQLDLSPDRLSKWRDVILCMHLPLGVGGLIEQFEGYFTRRDVDLVKLEPRDISVQMLFGIEGCSETQVLKQPDVLMLFHLLREEFDLDQVRQNYDYYTPRTDLTYGSSLGPSITAILACRLGEAEKAYRYFMQAAEADLKDMRGNASDGIHGASAGGIWQAVVFGFAGLRLAPGGVEISPHLPAHWKRLSFHFFHRGQLQTIDIRPDHP